MALDGGGFEDEPPRKTEVSVTVRLEDINDNVPKFERDSYSIEFSEDAKIGKDGDTSSGTFHNHPRIAYAFFTLNRPQYLPEGTLMNHLRIINATSFSVIVVNDADMDNNGKVEFSIKQDQPTFGIFSKAGFSSNQIASVYCPIREKGLIFNIFDEKLK